MFTRKKGKKCGFVYKYFKKQLTHGKKYMFTELLVAMKDWAELVSKAEFRAEVSQFWILFEKNFLSSLACRREKTELKEEEERISTFSTRAAVPNCEPGPGPWLMAWDTVRVWTLGGVNRNLMIICEHYSYRLNNLSLLCCVTVNYFTRKISLNICLHLTGI